ncbi:MAG: hypothetical protein VX614_03765 [Myxococcota bacterium]|nr:hypothetical protein [Myxococcota bacterium]
MSAFALPALLFVGAASVAADAPSRADFLAEFLTPEVSRFTARFGGTGTEPFRPEKLALARALPEAARAGGAELRMLLVIGPNGARDSYTVVTVLARGEGLEMNGLWLEGPKILRKGGTAIAPEALGRFVSDLTGSSLLRAGGATPELVEARLAAGEFPTDRRFDLLLALWSEASGAVFFFGDLRTEPRQEVRRLLSRANARLHALVPTFPRSPAAR